PNTRAVTRPGPWGNPFRTGPAGGVDTFDTGKKRFIRILRARLMGIDREGGRLGAAQDLPGRGERGRPPPPARPPPPPPPVPPPPSCSSVPGNGPDPGSLGTARAKTG